MNIPHTPLLQQLGFGASSLGNLYAPVSDDEARATLERAWTRGLRHFDTAPHYGRGLSERRLGDMLRGRDGYSLSTKAGRLLHPDAAMGRGELHDGFQSPMPFRTSYDYSADGILRSHEASLHRLGLTHVDTLLVHDIGTMTHGTDNHRHWDALTSGGGLKALDRLRGEGSVTQIGVGVNEIDACLAVMAEIRIDTILIAGRYTLLDQSALDRLLDACLASGTQVWLAAPFNGGILVTGTQALMPIYDYAPASARIIAKVHAIETIAARHGVALPAIALQFPLHHPAISKVIAGFRSADQVEKAVDWMAHPISPDLWTDLKQAGILHDDAPIQPALPAG
ncbi:MAG: aldo/keto reductase [Sphingobium sp.]